MAFNGQFSVALGPNSVQDLVFTDTSTGSDTNLTDRRITLSKADSTTLVPTGTSTTYIDWPLSAGSTLTLSGILAQDWSLNITVQWISSSPLPPPSSYISTQLKTFTGNLTLFLYGLSTMQSGNQLLIEDSGYLSNKSDLWVLIQDAINTANYGNQFVSQQSINSAYKFVNNQAQYFR